MIFFNIGKIKNELNGDIKEKDKDVPKFFGGSKEYDPKIIFDPDCLGNS